MEKNFMKIALAIAVVATGSYGSYKAYNKCIHQDNDLFVMNIEALSQGEGPSMLGCRSQNKATCYVFDGTGQLVDKRKNQYPGQ